MICQAYYSFCLELSSTNDKRRKNKNRIRFIPEFKNGIFLRSKDVFNLKKKNM